MRGSVRARNVWAPCLAAVVAASLVSGLLSASSFASSLASIPVFVATGQAAQDPAPPSAAELKAAIDNLGGFDYEVRTAAARTVRRTPAPVAIEALTQAVRAHDDEYVRYRALVLLAGLGEAAVAPLMREAVADRNDRMRTVAYGWFEHHPDPEVLPALLAALNTEASEFVRPALTRAAAALGTDPRVRQALGPLVLRGEDFVRGAVIEALGDYQGGYALEAIVEVARLDGPLQDDAITAMGRIGDAAAIPILVELQKTVPRELQPTLSASLCLLDRNCDRHLAFIIDSLRFGADNQNYQPLLRGAVHALAMLALRDRDEAAGALIAAGIPANDPARAPIALGVGLIALRNPEAIMRVLESRPDHEAAIGLIRDAFDMLSEDFEEERFYVAVRRAFWAAAEGSPRRALAETLIQQLDF
jgi:HEAT repeat protein